MSLSLTLSTEIPGTFFFAGEGAFFAGAGAATGTLAAFFSGVFSAAVIFAFTFAGVRAFTTASFSSSVKAKVLSKPV